MRVVIDTNVLISAAFFGGKPEILFSRIKENNVCTFTSKDIKNEYVEVFKRMRLKIIHPRKGSEMWLNYMLKVLSLFNQTVSSLNVETQKTTNL